MTYLGLVSEGMGERRAGQVKVREIDGRHEVETAARTDADKVVDGAEATEHRVRAVTRDEVFL